MRATVSRLRGALRLLLVALVCCAAFGLTASPAWATNLYVDEGGTFQDDGTACQDQADPCDTIGTALLFHPTPTDTIFVDSGTYTGTHHVERGLSIVAQNFDGDASEAQPVIDGGIGGPAIIISAEPEPAVGKIEGFVINGDVRSMSINDSVVVENNLFNENLPATETAERPADIRITGGTTAGGVVIRNNTFSDSISTDEQWGIGATGGTPTIEGNVFIGLREAIDVEVPATITANTISGAHEADNPDPTNPGILPGAGIVAVSSDGVIQRNVVHQPTSPANSIGIAVATGGAFVLERNRVVNHTFGVTVQGSGSVTLRGDIIANNFDSGLSVSDDGSGINTMSASVTNATIFGNGAEIILGTVDLSLDSTIVGESGILTFDLGESCTIAFSRGPTTTPGGDGCQNFQTTAAPGFVDPSPAVQDFHLAPGSAMIEQGNPTVPPPNFLDIDGQTRSLDGDCNSVAIRDIGADEFAADCVPPETTIDSGPSATTADTTPTFGFSSNEGGSTFQCALDGGAFGACSGPGATHTTATLGEGAHTFRVRATDAAGNTDQTPAERAFTVDVPDPPPPPRDTNPPDTSIRKGPRGRSPDQTPTFRFGSDEAGVTFRCRLDKQAFSRCGRRLTIRVGLGKHVMRVFAVDRAGNRDRTPAKRSFVVIARQRR